MDLFLLIGPGILGRVGDSVARQFWLILVHRVSLRPTLPTIFKIARADSEINLTSSLNSNTTVSTPTSLDECYIELGYW